VEKMNEETSNPEPKKRQNTMNLVVCVERVREDHRYDPNGICNSNPGTPPLFRLLNSPKPYPRLAIYDFRGWRRGSDQIDLALPSRTHPNLTWVHLP
jgi:hypothetical protein